MRPSSGLIAFVVVAELGIGVDAVECEDVIGDGSVRPGQQTLDVGVGRNTKMTAYFAIVAVGKYSGALGAKPKWATKVSHGWPK